MDPERPLRPLYLIDDEPIRSRASDKLDQRRYAGLIAEAALGTYGPFTIGVYGGWGQGKTSLLKHAKDLLDQRADDVSKRRLHPQLVTVFFNAWRYEREAHPIVPLIATIAQAVQRRVREDSQLSQRAHAAVKRWWERIVDAGKAVVGATKLDAKGRLGNSVVGQIEGGASINGGAMQRNYDELQAEREDAEALGVDPWIKQSLYLSAFDDLEALWDEEIVKAATPDNPAPRIVVFIDDLDRCQPEKAFELLEGIKLALAQPGFIFVLALNADIINRYLAIEARKRYGDDHVSLGERYLDKIVQLEVPMGSHKKAFAGFIESTVTQTLGAVIGDATGKAPTHFADAVLSLKELLGRFTDHTPRTLIRRLNSLIVDERLLPEDAPFEAPKEGENVAAHTARRRGYYMGLLLVQRTLVELPGVGVRAVRALHEHPDLCAWVEVNGLEPLYDKLKSRDDPELLMRKNENVVHLMDPQSEDGAKIAIKWLKLLEPFRGREEASELWQTEPGKAWLTDRAARTAVVELVVEVPVLVHGRRAEQGDDVRGEMDSGTLTRELSIIDRAIRRKLGLDDVVRVTAEIRGQVERLSLSSEPITDAGLKELADVDTGLKALTSLNLWNTQVTDEGMKALARADTGLKALTSLGLSNTKVTDEGMKALARADTGLKALSSLGLSGTQVTNEGMKALASPDTGLKALTSLDLSSTKVTDEGMKALASPDTGLKALTELYLWNTQVMDEAVRALARPDTGLKALTELSLWSTNVTDEGVKALAHADTGLKALTSLSLSSTHMTDDGAKALASADTGLKALTSLNLAGTRMTDDGVQVLASADTGLKALTSLYLANTKVTIEGVKAVKKRWPGITVYH